MTTWHAHEPLAEAIFYVLVGTVPDEGHFENSRATIGISIGDSSWGEEIREAFSDSGCFLKQ